jgi:hypothetical protein
MEDPAAFAANWYLVKGGIVSEDRRAFLHEYAIASVRDNLMIRGDDQVAGTPFAYCDPQTDDLLESMRGAVERSTGLSLWPTFSYMRVYRHGDLLPAHIDRPSCEISMTVNIGNAGDSPWPIWISGPNGLAEVALQPGDGLIYRGCDCYHWREPFDGDHLAQAFLHYVDRQGPNAAWKFDKRRGLSRPAPLARFANRPSASADAKY